MPPKDQLILDGAAALGWDAAPTQRNASDCGDCGACGFGCRRGAKRSGQRLHLAMAAGNGARLLTGARVERVDVKDGKAAGVSGQVRGRPFRVSARTVVLAAGAIRTPALLLSSGLNHPAIGANLHLHPTAVITALMSTPIEIWRGTTQGARSLELADRGVVIESAPAHPGLVAVALPWRGRTQIAQLMSEFGHSAPLIGITRDRDAGRVRLTRAGRPRIDYRISSHDATTARSGLLAMARIARAGGAIRVTALGTPGASVEIDAGERAFNRFLDRLAAFDFGPTAPRCSRPTRWARCAPDRIARTSASDPHGRVRSDANGGLVGGLYVGDASLFPTAVGVNPMVSVMLMAARVAEAIASS